MCSPGIKNTISAANTTPPMMVPPMLFKGFIVQFSEDYFL
jgi:hypothetical protein